MLRSQAIRKGLRGMKSLVQFWQTWAVLSAIFAAATAILAKVGVEAIGSDLATLIRTAVVLVLAALIVALGDGFGQIPTVPGCSWGCPALPPAPPGSAISGR
jgi:transporter family protein